MFVVGLLIFAAVAGPSWPVYRHDLDNSGYVTSTGASASGQHSVRLERRWTYVADSFITSTPVEADGLVFIGTWNGDVVALESTTGKVRWKAYLGANPDEVYGGPRGVVGSVAIDGGAVFAASGGCSVAAFDARSGARRWQRKVCDIGHNDDIYASSVVAGGLVLIGVDILADRPTSRGREIALDGNTGATRWSIDPAAYRGTGAGVSASPAVDTGLQRLYVGTGNPTPMLSPPAGDDPGSESIIAYDLKSGKKRWSFGPVHPHDTNDDDFLASPNRFAVGSRLHPRWVIGEGNKDGAYYGVSASFGKLVWRRFIDPSDQTAMILGTAAVGRQAVYIPLYRGSSGSLTALRATDGAILWQQSTGPESEAPVLWGSVVFTTEATGWLDAFAAGNGKPLGRWQLCGRAAGRGPSVAEDGLYVASAKCLIHFAAK
jgi:outer membrane protein assembly factor BamB